MVILQASTSSKIKQNTAILQNTVITIESCASTRKRPSDSKANEFSCIILGSLCLEQLHEGIELSVLVVRFNGWGLLTAKGTLQLVFRPPSVPVVSIHLETPSRQ